MWGYQDEEKKWWGKDDREKKVSLKRKFSNWVNGLCRQTRDREGLSKHREWHV